MNALTSVEELEKEFIGGKEDLLDNVYLEVQILNDPEYVSLALILSEHAADDLRPESLIAVLNGPDDFQRGVAEVLEGVIETIAHKATENLFIIDYPCNELEQILQLNKINGCKLVQVCGLCGSKFAAHHKYLLGYHVISIGLLRLLRLAL
jgi:hypothetical protein